MLKIWREIRLIASAVRVFGKPTLNTIVQRIERDHYLHNPTIAAHKYGTLRRLVRWFASRPGLTAVLTVATYGLTFFASRYVEPQWLGLDVPTGVADYYRDFISVAAGILATQGALVGLVFPLAIALVTLFFEVRTPTSGRLSVYLNETEALPVGASSLLLCVVITTQLPFAGQMPIRTIGALVLLDSLWFILNIAGLTYFLFKSFEYVRPETRKFQLNRFAINVAWREELRQLLAYTHLVNATHFGHLPKTASSVIEEDEDSSPFAKSPEVGVSILFESNGQKEFLTLRKECVLADVHLPILAVVAHRWLQDTLVSAMPSEKFGGPRLAFLPIINEHYSGQVALTARTKGTALSYVQMGLIRWAYQFKPVKTEARTPTSGTLLKEAMANVISLLEEGRTQEFDTSLDDLIDFHVLLFKIAEPPPNIGQGTYNFSQLSFGWKSVGDSWASEYRDLFKRVASHLRTDSEFFSHCAYLSSRLYREASAAVPPVTLGSVGKIAFQLFWRLGEWAAQTHKAETGVSGDPSIAFELRVDSQEIYSEAWRNFVAGWERLADEFYRGELADGDIWEKLKRPLQPLITHLDDTAMMVGASVWSGDLLATRWSTDLLLRWLSENEGHWSDQSTSWALDRSVVTTDLLTLSWPDVPVADFSMVEGVAVGPSELFGAAIENVWRDTVLVLTCKLLSWNQPPNTTGTAFIAARALIRNERYDHASARGDHAPLSNLSTALISILRVVASGGRYSEGYAAALNSLVERIHGLSQKPFVSLRVYSSMGANDFFQLGLQQLTVLACLVQSGPPPAGLPTDVSRYLRGLSSRPDEVSRAVRDHLEQLTNLLPALNTPDHGKRLSALREGEDPALLAEWINGVQEVLRLCVELLDASREERIRTARIDGARLTAIAVAASSTAFNKATSKFPINVFHYVELVKEQLDPHTIVHGKFAKGEITSPLMAQPDSDEARFWRNQLHNTTAGVALRDTFLKASIEEVDARTAEAWWLAIKAAAATITGEGGKPILLLSSRVEPPWFFDWIWDRERGHAARPADLKIMRNDSEKRDGYEANINDIEVFQAPIEQGCSYLMSVGLFRKIEFSELDGGLPVVVDFIPNPTDLWHGELRATWRRRVTVGDGRIIRIRHSGGTPRPKAPSAQSD